MHYNNTPAPYFQHARKTPACAQYTRHFIATQQKRKCAFHTESMLPMIRLHPEMSLGAYFQYEIYTSVFAVYLIS